MAARSPVAPRLPLAVLAAALDALLPRRCLLCARTLGGGIAGWRGLCDGCLADLPGRGRPRCPRCGIDAAQAPPSHPCLPLDGLDVLADYAPPLDGAIRRMKFRRDPSIATPLGRCLAEAFAPVEADAAVVVAVPVSAARLAERGFDQARAIARACARAHGARLRDDLLVRTRDTPPQSGLDRAHRLGNLDGAWRCGDARGLDVVLVDDVTTTGSTLASAADALRRAGARTVRARVVARTP